MSEVSEAPASAYRTATTRLCPWLRDSLRSMTRAHASRGLGHAWLIAGPPGTGKLNLAMVLAHHLLSDGKASAPQELSCEQAGVFAELRKSPADTHPDLRLTFPLDDKRTISVDQIRDASAALSLKSMRGGAKVMILEPAEAMTTAAANALLKTLEEPTQQTWIVLISHQPGRLPATIRSRCQQLPIARPAVEVAVRWLGGSAPERVLALAGGSPLMAGEWYDDEISRFINSLEGDIEEISSMKSDPLTVAKRWLDADGERALRWLIRRLHAAIRDRVVPGSTQVTDESADRLHNLWSALTLRSLLDQLDTAETLLGRFGSGMNLELSLGVLLQGLSPASRRSSDIRTREAT